MNILHTETLLNWGGEQNKVLNEMLLMRELGHNVFLFCNPNSQISKIASEHGFSIITQKMSKTNYQQAIPALSKAVAQNNINLVISHGSTDSWVAGIAGLKWRKKGVKFARERHNLFKIKGYFSKLLHKKFFDYIFYISPSVCEYLKSINVSNSKLIYTPSTIDTSYFENYKSNFKQKSGLQRSFCFGTFTSLYEEKGVYELASAANLILGELDCKIIFGGNITDEVKAKCQEILGQNQKNVIFTGFRNDGANIIKACDIFIFPSHSEGLGTAILEAMACERAVIVFDKEPMNELIKHENRGLCATYKDPKSLAKCAIKLAKNEKLAQEYAQNALSFVKENYDHKVLKNKLKNFLDLIQNSKI